MNGGRHTHPNGRMFGRLAGWGHKLSPRKLVEENHYCDNYHHKWLDHCSQDPEVGLFYSEPYSVPQGLKEQLKPLFEARWALWIDDRYSTWCPSQKNDRGTQLIVLIHPGCLMTEREIGAYLKRRHTEIKRQRT